MSDRKAEMETVTATFTFTGADALSTSSFSIWKVSSEAATMLAGSESSWTEGEQTFTTTEGLNAGERLVLIWNSNNGVRYKIWCFRGGYGISTNPAPDVYASYGNANCPRLYRIMEVTKGEDVTYAWGGHPNDNVEGQSMGLNHSSGAIGNKNYLSNTLVRGEGKSDATDAAVQWAFEPVQATSLMTTLQFGETGYATFSSCATVKIPSSVTVYEVINTTNGYVQMNELSGTIPANAGVIVKANPNALISFVPTNGLGKGMKAVNTDGTLGEEVDKDNKLVAAVKATTIAEGDYILAKNAEGEVVFGIIGAETGIANITKPATLNGKMIEGNRVVIVKNGLKYTLSGQRIK